MKTLINKKSIVGIFYIYLSLSQPVKLFMIPPSWSFWVAWNNSFFIFSLYSTLGKFYFLNTNFPEYWR